MTPQELKNSILQLAIQGKLVEQRPEEGTAEELYKQIQAEKQKLIKAGKIKKDWRTDAINMPLDEDFPFEIPETWKWVYLGSILNKLTDGTHKTPKYSINGVKFVSVKDMSSGVLSLKNTKYITTSEHKELFARCDPVRGDMLLSKVGTTGVPAIVDTDEPFSLFVSVALLKYSHDCIDELFLYYLLKSPLVQIQAIGNTRGVGNKNWVLDAIAKTMIVLPPLAEQKRIAAKIEELLPLVERYGEAWSRLEEFNKRFPDDMQKAILQMAIQGKLVEQRPEEGTAEELYKQIQAEKQKLIKAGKLKKEKPLPEISEDEIPFEIPESWKWVRLNSVISLLSGSDLTPNKYNGQGKGIPYITGASNIENNSIIINRWTESPNNVAYKGDLLLTCKGTVGKTAILLEKEVHIARQIMAITPIVVETSFIQRFIESQVDGLKKKAKSMIPGIERDNVLKLTFPLPPLAEQKRIVARIEELLPLCGRLK